jgi:arabinogalactan endo-1,4-beta-galactosidase
MKFKYFFFLFILCFFTIFCSRSQNPAEVTAVSNSKILEIKGAELSLLPELRASGEIFYNQNKVAEDMLTTLKNSGVNTIRLRLWVNPSTPTSGLDTVKSLAQEVKNNGLKVLLNVQYSDTWTDPGNQLKPNAWQNDSFETLKTDVYNYTQKIVQEINPDYIQIGNEINNGFLFPEGRFTNLSQFKALLLSGISAVRNTNSKTKIIVHFAGFVGAADFYSKISDLDFDIIGLSYYPIYHGKDLTLLQQNLTQISNQSNKPICIVETSYPFTFGYNDFTTNIIGDNSQIIPDFPATPDGQKAYLTKIKQIAMDVPKGSGFCYWGDEWTAFKGKTSTQGSAYENQAFWDFNNKALPVLDVYK